MTTNHHLWTNAVASRLPKSRYKALFGIAFVVVFIGVAMAHFAFQLTWAQDPSSAENRIKYVERIQFSPFAQPKVLVLGSSRPAFGVRAQDLARTLGHEPGSGKNIAFPGIYGENLLAQVRNRYYEVTQAKTWIISVDDYFLLRKISPLKDERLSPADRVDEMLKEWLSPVMKLNEDGRNLNQNAKVVLGWAAPKRIDVWTVSDSGAWSDESLKGRVVDVSTDKKVFESIAESYLAYKVFDPELMRPYEEILRIAKKHQISVVVVDMPYHPYYEKIVSDRYASLARQNREAFKVLASRYGAKFIDCPNDPTNCAASEMHFGDPVHLNAEGAKQFTKFLGTKIH